MRRLATDPVHIDRCPSVGARPDRKQRCHNTRALPSHLTADSASRPFSAGLLVARDSHPHINAVDHGRADDVRAATRGGLDPSDIRVAHG